MYNRVAAFYFIISLNILSAPLIWRRGLSASYPSVVQTLVALWRRIVRDGGRAGLKQSRLAATPAEARYPIHFVMFLRRLAIEVHDVFLLWRNQAPAPQEFACAGRAERSDCGTCAGLRGQRAIVHRANCRPKNVDRAKWAYGHAAARWACAG